MNVGGLSYFFFFQAEDGIRDYKVTGVQTCALPIYECATKGGKVRRRRWGGEGRQRNREEKSAGDQHRERHQLEDRKNVLRNRRGADTDVVDAGMEDYCSDR